MAISKASYQVKIGKKIVSQIQTIPSVVITYILSNTFNNIEKSLFSLT